MNLNSSCAGVVVLDLGRRITSRAVGGSGKISLMISI